MGVKAAEEGRGLSLRVYICMMCVYLCGVGAKIGYPKSFSDKG